jgi:hypothetical protein
MGVHASKEHGEEEIVPSCFGHMHSTFALYKSAPPLPRPFVCLNDSCDLSFTRGRYAEELVQRIASRMHTVVAASPVPIQGGENDP